MPSVRYLRAALATGLLLAVFLTGFGFGRSVRPLSPGLSVAMEADQILRREALEAPADAAVSREAVRGLITALDDPFADYLPRRTKGAAVGIADRALGDKVGDIASASGITGRALGGGIGVVRLKLFAPRAGVLVASEVRRLRRLGVKKLILDVRGSPGGLVDEALQVAGLFVGDAVVFRYRTSGGGEGTRRGKGTVLALPLVILVDRKTASSAELVAGAIQDHGRGIIVGERTRGKGSVQKVISLSDGSAIKFTTAVYRTPDGREVDGNGIEPDVVVAGSGDVALERAKSILRAQ